MTEVNQPQKIQNRKALILTSNKLVYPELPLINRSGWETIIYVITSESDNMASNLSMSRTLNIRAILLQEHPS